MSNPGTPMNSPRIEAANTGAPWLTSPIDLNREYFDCDTDLSGLGICLKQSLQLQPSSVTEAFPIEKENCTVVVEPYPEDNSELSQMLEEALRAQELEFRMKLLEKDEMIKSLEEVVEQQKKKSSEPYNRLVEYEKEVMDRFNELKDLTDELKALNIEKNEVKEDCKALVKEVNMFEDSFSLLHKNYEKVKVIVENFNRNEELLNARFEGMEKLVANRDGKTEYIKQQVEEKIILLKREYESKLHEVESEHTKLKAMICMDEVRMRQLEAGVIQKTREVEQLRDLCQEIIKGEK